MVITSSAPLAASAGQPVRAEVGGAHAQAELRETVGNKKMARMIQSFWPFSQSLNVGHQGVDAGILRAWALCSKLYAY
jgi:hypothetical protein